MMEKHMSIKVRNSDTINAIKADMEKRGMKTNAEWVDTIVQNINMLPKFNFGEIVLDTVTGFFGEVTGFENYYDQMSNRYLVEDICDRRWICESRLKLFDELNESEDE